MFGLLKLMKAILQRVKSAYVYVNNNKISSINNGLLVFLGIKNNDDKQDVNYIINKIISLRIFNDNENKMNLSINDIQGEILVVSQFTLYANTKRGRRPSFVDAAEPDLAKKIYDTFCSLLQTHNVNVKTGKFGANMEINLINEGPVTIILDSNNK